MSPRVLDASAAAAAFPLGGIGTGNVSIGARGELRDWELANRPQKGGTNPFSFFAIHVADDAAAPDDATAPDAAGDRRPEASVGSITRVLEARLRAPHEADQGYPAHAVGGLPRLADTRLRGRYPLLELDFVDDRLPLEVSLTAFTPFVPLDADDSGLPCAVLRYRVENRSDRAMRVAIAGSIANPVGASADRDVFHFPRFDGHPRIDWRDADGIRGLVCSSDLPADHLAHGTATLTTPDTQVTAKPQWLYGFWQDGAQRFWDDFRDDGRLEPEPVETLDPPPHPEWMTRLRVGSLAIEHVLAPGEGRDFEFRLTWHFPNRPRGWAGNIIHDDPHLGEVVRNHYATRHPDAWAVAADLDRRLPQLEATTRAFVDALYDSTLPDAVIDAIGSNLAVIRSSTCFRLEGGAFAAWEGSFDHVGSCEGTCTHVWNYAQSLAWLFPELERSARRTEFLLETRDDGRMNFRTNQIFGSPAWDFHPAVDGQLGAIVRVYREWLLSGDDDFVREVWPAVCRALDYAFAEWDANGDGVLDSKQHNTYDIEFFGENSLANSMFFAALRAGAALADRLGETGDEHARERAAAWRAAAETGAARMDALLYNGEYYAQRIADVDLHRYQYGEGVLSDQLLGQLLAHVVGLGHVLPAEHVRSAIGAVFRHNFRADLSEHHSVQRTYALNDEGGLLLCTWPRGGRPRIPFVYSDEVWTGIEYQVAAHLAFEGLTDEALTIVEATRARHAGDNRNPWNEVECGNHYARSLASWALLPAFTGAASSVADGTLDFAPRLPGDQRWFFSTGTAWGRVEISERMLRLDVFGGELHLTTLTLSGRALQPEQAHPTVIGAGTSLGFPILELRTQ
jgi:non-lysosomal glucosylceramidase